MKERTREREREREREAARVLNELERRKSQRVVVQPGESVFFFSLSLFFHSLLRLVFVAVQPIQSTAHHPPTTRSHSSSTPLSFRRRGVPVQVAAQHRVRRL